MHPCFALLGDVGGLELLVIALIALVMFGAKRLPELGRAAGRAIREFKKATSGVEENLREVMRDDPLKDVKDVLRPAPRQVSRGRSASTASSPAPSSASTATSPTSAPGTVPPPATTPGTNPAPASGAVPPPPRVDPAPGTEDEIAG